MAESVCLRRSFSNPSQILHGIQEEDAARILGESISFGRYVSDSLAWERWSAFSRNRNLEEAEKYSKPGSVAKMKAFFEAHYRQVASKKREVKKQISTVVEPQAQINIEIRAKRRSIIDEANIECGEAKVHDMIESTRCLTPDKIIVKDVDVIENSDGIENTLQNKLHIKELEKRNSMSIQKSADSPVKQRGRKTEGSSLKQRVEKTDTPLKQHGRKTGDSSVKQPAKSSNVSKISSASLARLSTPKCPKMEGRETPDGKKFGKESVNKRRSASKSANVSVNADVKKTSSMSSRKAGIGRIFTPIGKAIRDRFTSPGPSKETGNSVVRHPSATPQSEIKRSKVVLEKSFRRSKTMDSSVKSPDTRSVTSSVLSTSTQPFKLRTEERAAKRREMLQKKVEKEADNSQQSAKLKPESRKSSLSVYSKPGASTNIRTEALSNDAKKVASPRTPVPNCASKLASDRNQPTLTQTTHKTTTTTTTTTTSRFNSEKGKQLCEPTPKPRLERCKTVSTPSISKAETVSRPPQENTSPNIL